MRRLILLGVMLGTVLRGAPAEEGKFSSSVSAEDLAAIGLAGSTPAQLARLDALVEAYKSGALATARRAAADALAAKQVAEAQAARAEARIEASKVEAAKAEAARVAAAKADSAKPSPAAGILAKAKVLLTPGTQVEKVTLESSIPGKFRGWEPRQVFTLANGQRWQVAGNDRYFTPAVESPKVQIIPAAVAGNWLRFPDLGVEVRVNLIDVR